MTHAFPFAWPHEPAAWLIGLAYIALAWILWGLTRYLRSKWPILILLALTLAVSGLVEFLQVWNPGSTWIAWTKVMAASTAVLTACYLFRHRRALAEALADSEAASRYRAKVELASAELIEREKTLGSFFDSAPMMMGIADLEGDDIRHVSDNLPAVAFFGQSDASMRGKLASELGVPQEGIAFWIQHYKQAEREKRPVSFEYSHETAAGLRQLSVAVSQIGQGSQGHARFSYIAQDVTDMRRAEAGLRDAKRLLEERIDARTAELRASEEKFAKMFELAPFSFALVTLPDGHLRDVNPAWTRLMGYSYAEAIGRTSQDLLFYENDEERERLYADFAATGHVRNHEVTIRTKQGATRVVSANMDLIEIAGVPHALGTMEDITERRRATEELRESEQRFRTVTNNAASCLFMMDKRGHPTFMNPAAMQVCGYQSLQEIKDRPLHYAVHWKKADGSPYPMEECPIDNAQAELKAVQNQEELFCRKDGSLFPVCYSIAPLEKDGEVIGSVLEFRDITKEKESRLALRESEARYRVLADTVPHLVFTNDAAGKATYFNYQWTLYTGRTQAWLLEHPFAMVHPDDLDRINFGKTQAMQHGQPGVAEIRLRSAAGSYQWHSLKVVPLLDQQGTILAWYGAVVNIEDQKRAQEVLRTAKDELEHMVKQRTAELQAANQELESFSYSVSHDLRAPLRSINGFSKRLLRRLEGLEDDAKEDLERIRAASVRMGRLIDDLLMLSRVARTELRLSWVNLSELAAEIVGELRQSEPDRGAIDVHISPDIVVWGDASLLLLVLQNLIGNAWKFTRHVSEGWIQISGQREGDGVQVVVSDNGAGFDMEYAGQLFVPFQRLHTEDEFEGTGIGLATVRRIIRKHGGEIRASSEPGKGATFYFTLPNGLGRELHGSENFAFS